MLLSPRFNVSPGSPGRPWRDSVSEVWEYIRTRQSIRVDEYVGTTIQLSLEPTFTLPEVKRIAQSAIHFEPAIEALMPDLDDNGLNYASNWLMSWDFAPSGRSRPDAIELLEYASNPSDVAGLMQRNDPLGHFTWEFKHLDQGPQARIDFHRCPACHNAEEAIRYPEFTMCFVRAAMLCSRDQLLTIPSNVGGMRWFMDRFRTPWLYNNCHRMPSLWRMVPFNAIAGPKLPEWTSKQRRYMAEQDLSDGEELAAQDLERCQAFAARARAPYC
jgi:hypothetical protein